MGTHTIAVSEAVSSAFVLLLVARLGTGLVLGSQEFGPTLFSWYTFVNVAEYNHCLPFTLANVLYHTIKELAASQATLSFLSFDTPCVDHRC